MPNLQTRLDQCSGFGTLKSRKPIPPLCKAKKKANKSTVRRDSHLYEPSEVIGCGIFVLVGVLNGNTTEMAAEVAEAICKREALREKKKMYEKEKELFFMCRAAVVSRHARMSPKCIKGPGRGKGMWVRHGPMDPATYEEGSIRGLWTDIFEDVIKAHDGRHLVVVLSLQVWKTDNGGRPKLIGWTTEVAVDEEESPDD